MRRIPCSRGHASPAHRIGGHGRRVFAVLLSFAAHPLLLATVDLRRDVLLAEDLLGRVQIVRATADTKVRRVIAATERAGLDVIELEARPALATASFGIN